MKRNHIFISLFVLLLCSCGGSDSIAPEPTPQPNPDPEPATETYVFGLTDSNKNSLENISFGKEGGTFIMKVTANSSWSASTSGSWLSLEPSKGVKGVTEVKVTASGNATTSERKTSVAVKSGSRTLSVNVTQKPDWTFSASPFPADPAVAFAKGGSQTIELTCESDWQVTGMTDWLTVTPSSGQAGANQQITITTSPNESGADREASLLVVAGDDSQEYSIVQRQNIFTKVPQYQDQIMHAGKYTYPDNYVFYRTVFVIPYPETNEYQDIESLEYGTATIGTSTSPGKSKYLLSDVRSNFPPSSSYFVYHRFKATVYNVSTDFSKITDRSLEYDTASEEYKGFTGKSVAHEGYNMIDPTNADVRNIADQLWQQAGGDRVEYARACYEWVSSSFSYGIYGGNNSVEEIMARRSGDCGNQHVIWISLMRCKGIPARPVVMVSPDDYTHVRAEFYMPAYGWIPVDVTYHQSGGDYFGKYKDNLVVMNREFPITLTAGQDTYTANLLQVGYFLYWIYEGEGDTSADFIFRYD